MYPGGWAPSKPALHALPCCRPLVWMDRFGTSRDVAGANCADNWLQGYGETHREKEADA